MKPLQVFLLSKLSIELGRRQHGSHCWTTRSAMMPWLSQDRGPSHLAAAGYSLEDDSEDEASSVEHLELEGSQGAWDWVSSMRPKHETPSHQIAFPDLIFSGHILGQGWVLATAWRLWSSGSLAMSPENPPGKGLVTWRILRSVVAEVWTTWNLELQNNKI